MCRRRFIDTLHNVIFHKYPCGRNSFHSLTHWGRVTHICVSKLTIIGSDNGLSPGRRQAFIWTKAEILLIQTSGTNFSEILGEIHSFSFKKMHLKISSAKGRLFSLGLNELNRYSTIATARLYYMPYHSLFFIKSKTIWLHNSPYHEIQ